MEQSGLNCKRLNLYLKLLFWVQYWLPGTFTFVHHIPNSQSFGSMLLQTAISSVPTTGWYCGLKSSPMCNNYNFIFIHIRTRYKHFPVYLGVFPFHERHWFQHKYNYPLCWIKVTSIICKTTQERHILCFHCSLHFLYWGVWTSLTPTDFLSGLMSRLDSCMSLKINFQIGSMTKNKSHLLVCCHF